MREVPVGFPNDETSAELIASRLRADGIPARVDRGLWGSYQVPLARGHVTVLVAERDAGRARRVVGTVELRDSGTHRAMRLWIALLVGSLGVTLVLWPVSILTGP